MRKRHGFTLIELLVVIAVIALLMGILMPGLSKAKEQAKKTVCAAHMKGLGVSMRMYADDNDGMTHKSPNVGLWDNTYEDPSTVTAYGPNDGNAYWGIAYYPYSKNKKIFRCPSTKRVDDWPEWGWGLAYQQYFRYCSYGINGYVTWNSKKGKNCRIDSDFKTPNEVIAFQDHIEQKLDDNGDMFYIPSGASINLSQWRNGGTLGDFPNAVEECFRHEKASNTCWLDGHVSAIAETTGEDVPSHWYTGVRTSL